MALALDELAEPFVPVQPAAARAALSELWGIDAGELTRLDTERDDTFRAGEMILKIAHPNDSATQIAMQAAATRHVHAADPGIPIQRVIGEPAIIDGRIARVLTWIDGEPVGDQDLPLDFFTDAGRMLGRLTRALADFTHPGEYRALAWDLLQLDGLRGVSTDPVHSEFINRFASETIPVLELLPQQVIHNDGHPGNLLVSDGRLAGILDFGDAVRSARVCDLAVAMAYLVPDDAETWDEAHALRDGYLESLPLLEAELEQLPMLMAARTIMRTVINDALGRNHDPDFAAENDRKLRRILKEA